MPNTADMQVSDRDPAGAVNALFSRLLESGAVDAILVAKQQGKDRMILPTLVSDPALLEGADPLAPAFALNAARMLSRLTRRPSGKMLAAMLRPCEIRAFIELVKLNQASTENLVIIGSDCLGAFPNSDYFAYMEENGGHATGRFIRSVLSDQGEAADAEKLSAACRTCTRPVPEGADLAVRLFGVDVGSRIQVHGQTPRGEKLLAQSGLLPAEPAPGRAAALAALLSRRTAAFDALRSTVGSAASTLETLSAYFSRCINCYNCRVACPVCYCRECVFATDVFDHEPLQYFKWARRKGEVKMPTDTLFYHLTRMAHMSASCVGCGQCSNACPSGIAVMELFSTVAADTQEAFRYVPGRSVEEAAPLSEFKEKEFEDVVGIG
jgi:formate dehydrogenase subunit beta